jgi:hypothetical protein
MISYYYNITTSSAVASIGASFGITAGPMKANNSITTLAGGYFDFYYICKHLDIIALKQDNCHN